MTESVLDRIHIRDLQCRCIVGINDDERHKIQDITVNIVMHADLHKACESDDIADTIDYKGIKLAVLKMVEESSYFLVERLATEIARVCLEDSRVQRVDVAVDKPGALRFARSVAVEIVRDQQNRA